ncbi:MAG: hypothetical protein ACLQCU_13670 [Acidimicrobiales bacterium]
MRCFLATRSGATFTCWSEELVVLLSGADRASARLVERAALSARLVERADKAVYFAKASGRDKVGVAD